MSIIDSSKLILDFDRHRLLNSHDFFPSCATFCSSRGCKVASTSFEVALAKICDAEDVITPITPEDERHRINLGYRHFQNFGADPEKLKNYIDTVKTADTDQSRQLKLPK